MEVFAQVECVECEGKVCGWSLENINSPIRGQWRKSSLHSRLPRHPDKLSQPWWPLPHTAAS